MGQLRSPPCPGTGCASPALGSAPQAPWRLRWAKPKVVHPSLEAKAAVCTAPGAAQSKGKPCWGSEWPPVSPLLPPEPLGVQRGCAPPASPSTGAQDPLGTIPTVHNTYRAGGTQAHGMGSPTTSPHHKCAALAAGTCPDPPFFPSVCPHSRSSAPTARQPSPCLGRAPRDKRASAMESKSPREPLMG